MQTCCAIPKAANFYNSPGFLKYLRWAEDRYPESAGAWQRPHRAPDEKRIAKCHDSIDLLRNYLRILSKLRAPDGVQSVQKRELVERIHLEIERKFLEISSERNPRDNPDPCAEASFMARAPDNLPAIETIFTGLLVSGGIGRQQPAAQVQSPQAPVSYPLPRRFLGQPAQA